MKNIVHIVGNRPQFIKLAVLHEELARHDYFLQKIIHTGQHASSDMSSVFFHQLNIPEPDLHLQIENTGNPDLFIGKTSASIQQYFAENRNSIAFLFGDTNTTLAAALAARRMGIPIYHFEAGIRTGDHSMPEEINRIITDRLADVNYCCTMKNFRNMEEEGYGRSIGSRILLTGDLMYDAFLKIPFGKKPGLPAKKYVASTIHRVANILSPENLSAIVEALNNLNKELPVYMPLHPHTARRLKEYHLKPTFTILDPMGYPEMKTFLSESEFIITDSGGAAREAFFCGKKSVIVMDKPFWPEILEAGCGMSTRADADEIGWTIAQLPGLRPEFHNPIFGKGNAAKLVAEDLAEKIPA